MRPVNQTIRGNCGNCHAACVASILELPLEQMPDHFLSEDGEVDARWLDIWNEFLRPRNLHMVWYEARAGRVPRGYAIAGMLNADGSHHAVVFHDGVQVHDPLGGGANGPVDYWYVLTVLDPSRGTRESAM
jgi:hypothetical protein